MSDIDNTPISPMKLARQLKIPPQKIYGLIRQKRIKEVSQGGKKLVYPQDVVAVLAASRGPGRPSTHQQLEDFKINPGTVLTWIVEVHKQVAVVEKSGDNLTRMQGMLRGKQQKPKDVYVQNINLAQHIKEGIITTSDCDQVLEAIVLSWRLNGRSQHADDLQAFIDNLDHTNLQASDEVSLQDQ